MYISVLAAGEPGVRIFQNCGIADDICRCGGAVLFGMFIAQKAYKVDGIYIVATNYFMASRREGGVANILLKTGIPDGTAYIGYFKQNLL